MLRCAMNRDKEQVGTAPVSATRRGRGAPTGSALSDDVYNRLLKIVRALARSTAVAEHQNAEYEKEDRA
jgi:hypothetical protein